MQMEECSVCNHRIQLPASLMISGNVPSFEYQNSPTLTASWGFSYASFDLDFFTPAVNQTLSDL